MSDTVLPSWCRAYGAPLFSAVIRERPEDFQVVEQLGWVPTDDGEHDYLWIEKTGANTDWVAGQVAGYAAVPLREVGFAGLKDRHAVTCQWFSVPRWNSPDWSSFTAEGVRILRVGRHRRKLRRGAHEGNAFRITLRVRADFDHDDLGDRIAGIEAGGIPNYFGEQRFGRSGANLGLADSWASGKRLSRPKRSLAISTIRSFVFNEALSMRVAAQTWAQLMPGDYANLDGSASIFSVEQLDETLRRRCADMDIHPAIELVGDGSTLSNPAWQRALHSARVEVGSRSLRCPVRSIDVCIDKDRVTLGFFLPRGAYATAVLHEICEL